MKFPVYISPSSFVHLIFYHNQSMKFLPKLIKNPISTEFVIKKCFSKIKKLIV